jgi:hypothetical protein
MWSSCPGSLAMQDLLDQSERNVSSYFARLGTCAHALLERVLGEGATAEDYRGRIIRIVGEDEGTSILKKGAKAPKDPQVFWVEVDDDMIESVDVAVSYVRRRLQETFGHSDTKLAVAKKQLHLESRLTILVDRVDSFGTGDIRIDNWPEWLEIVDYKHGQGVVVEVTGNKQLRSYALGAAEIDRFDHETYRYTVAQPRAPHPEGGVRSEEMTRSELLAWKVWLASRAEQVDRADEIAHHVGSDMGGIAAAVEVPQALMAAGMLCAGDHCRWCDAKYNRKDDVACPAIRAAAQAAAVADFDDDPATDLSREVPRDPEELGAILRWIPVADQFFREVVTLPSRPMTGTHRTERVR